MNTKFQKLVFATFIIAGLFSCQKSESVDSQYESAVTTADSTSVQNDEVSYAASQQIPDKKFQLRDLGLRFLWLDFLKVEHKILVKFVKAIFCFCKLGLQYKLQNFSCL